CVPDYRRNANHLQSRGYSGRRFIALQNVHVEALKSIRLPLKHNHFRIKPGTLIEPAVPAAQLHLYFKEFKQQLKMIRNRATR
ncbi:hypothetical protein J6590_086592, partial [Homalodisca vitripennis]